MLEKTKEVIQNRQSRYTDITGHRRKINKTKNTTQKTRKMSNTDKKTKVNPGACEG
jgi:hypothetical protein